MGNNLMRHEEILPREATLRQAIEQSGDAYTGGLLHLDGAPLKAGDLDKTFEELGVTEKCFLLSVTKADNA